MSLKPWLKYTIIIQKLLIKLQALLSSQSQIFLVESTSNLKKISLWPNFLGF